MMQKRNGEYATDDEATRSPILVFQNVTAGYSGLYIAYIKVLMKVVGRRGLALSSHKGGGLAGDLMVRLRPPRVACDSVSYWRRNSYE